MASVNAKSAGNWVTATPYGKAGGSWSAVQTIYERISGNWTAIWSAMTVAISPDHINTSGSTATVSAVVTGGTSPYTYAWSWQSGGAGITIGSPTGSSTLLTKTGTGEQSGTLLLQVTDASGVGASATASILLGLI